jgi:signal recognition particle subunit SRP54
MFVGLQGAGKTTTVAKYAHYYMQRKFRVAMVCADTFRAGAFDQLKQNAVKVRVPFYGSDTEANPVTIAREGVAHFREAGYEIIIVDTSGRHKQESGLFEEMREVAAAVQPDDVVFVMDGSIGAAAFPQAEAFRAAIDVGSVIVTKLDGHAKGGGALSAVAATGSPITFVGSGEHFDDFAAFDANGFVSKLLGRGDMKSLLADMKDKGIMEDSEAMMGRAAKGKFTYRDLHEQYTSLMKLGSVSKLMEAIPGMAGMAGMAGPEGNAQFKMFIVIMQSMTKKELDCRVVIDQPRALRLARGAGVHPQAVHVLTEQLKQMSQMMTGINKSGLMKGGDNSLSAKMRRNPKEIQQKLGKNIDPAMLSKLGGVDNFMKLLGERATSFALAPCCVPPFLRRRATSARPARLPLHPLQAPAPTGTCCPRRRA